VRFGWVLLHGERKRSRREAKERRRIKEREKVNMYSGADVEITVGGVARGHSFM
jgi:hypothetical protein